MEIPHIVVGWCFHSRYCSSNGDDPKWRKTTRQLRIWLCMLLLLLPQHSDVSHLSWWVYKYHYSNLWYTYLCRLMKINKSIDMCDPMYRHLCPHTFTIYHNIIIDICSHIWRNTFTLKIVKCLNDFPIPRGPGPHEAAAESTAKAVDGADELGQSHGFPIGVSMFP